MVLSRRPAARSPPPLALGTSASPSPPAHLQPATPPSSLSTTPRPPSSSPATSRAPRGHLLLLAVPSSCSSMPSAVPGVPGTVLTVRPPPAALRTQSTRRADEPPGLEYVQAARRRGPPADHASSSQGDGFGAPHFAPATRAPRGRAPPGGEAVDGALRSSAGSSEGNQRRSEGLLSNQGAIRGSSEAHQRLFRGSSEAHQSAIRGSSEAHQRPITGQSQGNHRAITGNQRLIRGSSEGNQRHSAHICHIAHPPPCKHTHPHHHSRLPRRSSHRRS